MSNFEEDLTSSFELDGADVVFKGGDAKMELDGADLPSRPAIENLVFRGGGVKGIAYCGALKILSDMHFIDDVKRYAGSSAGAISAALLALGYTIPELEAIFLNLNMSDFKDAKGNIVSRVERFYRKFGMYEGKYFYDWISSCIEKKADPSITFKQVLDTFGKELIIVGCCISHMEAVYFSPRDHPDMAIRDALRISMSIPILFEPVRIGEHLYVDGGLADNFPLCAFDSETGFEDARQAGVNTKTLGFFLQENRTRGDLPRKVNKIQDYVSCLLDTVKTRIAALQLKPGDKERTIFIQTHHINATKFNIGSEDKEMLYDEGQKSAREFVGRFGISDPLLLSPTWGRLIVHLKHGEGLHHSRLASSLYAVMKLGNTTKKTGSTLLNKSNPKWDERFVFPVGSSSDIFKVELFEDLIVRPRCIGNYSVPISNYKGLHCAETCIDLGKGGSILLDITLSAY